MLRLRPCHHRDNALDRAQAPVPLSIFRSNSKFDENSKHCSVKYTWPITTKLERYKFSSNSNEICKVGRAPGMLSWFNAIRWVGITLYSFGNEHQILPHRFICVDVAWVTSIAIRNVVQYSTQKRHVGQNTLITICDCRKRWLTFNAHSVTFWILTK